MAAAARAAARAAAVRSATARFAAQSKPAASPFHAIPNPLSSRLLRASIVTGVCVESLQPLHTAIASSRMVTMLAPSPSAFAYLLQSINDGTS